jgi:hypothetical protein
MTILSNETINFNKNVTINFEGGNLTSDAGLLAYKVFDDKIGLSKSIKNIFPNKKDLIHQTADVFNQIIYQTIAGYHSDQLSNELMNDPTFQLIFNKKLATQSTISRRLNNQNEKTLNQLRFINNKLLNESYRLKRPEYVVLDIDSTYIETYGNQENKAFNYHYKNNGFHPQMVFDGLTGDLIKSDLRSGNVYTSTGISEFIEPILKHYKNQVKPEYIIIRGDSGYAKPELYRLAEKNSIDYTIRLKANKKLYDKAQDLTDEFIQTYKDDFSKTHVMYGEFLYKAESWNHPRRVVCKLKRTSGQIYPTYTFVVTSMSTTPKKAIMFYNNRGTMENFIKEAKLDFGMDHASYHSFMANQIKLALRILAYNLNNLMRRLVFPEKLKNKRMISLRTILTKIAGKLTKSARYFTLKLSSHYAYKKHFYYIFKAVKNL